MYAEGDAAVTANLSIAQGHDVEYYTRSAGGGHVGGVAYYAAAVGDNPPGVWAGTGAARLGLQGLVKDDVIHALFHQDIAPGGERLGNTRARQYQDPEVYAEEAVLRYREQHPFASSRELDRVRVSAKAEAPHNRPFFDVTIAAAKSVSLVFASLITDAQEHRDAGDDATAVQLEEQARAIEDALVQTALGTVREIEQVACYTRTGHHPGGEWRDAAGVTAALFPQYLSHEGDPHLHVHILILNRVQRADGEDTKWRTLDGTQLYAQKPYLHVLADRDLEVRLAELGWEMEMRADGNGAEIAGVSRELIEEYSTRAQVITPEIRRYVEEWKAASGGQEPSARTIKIMKQWAWKTTRAEADSDAEAMRKKGMTPAVDLPLADLVKQWDARAVRLVQGGLRVVHDTVRDGARGRARRVLDYEAKARAARIAVARVQEQFAAWSMAQLIHHVGRALPAMKPTADSKALVAEVARMAVSGRAGTDAVMVTAPDIADVSSLGVRASDGATLYRPPHEQRWTTLQHLDTEARILETALRPAPPLVRAAEAKAVAAQTDLSAAQQDALVKMLTAPTSTAALVAPAGAGKSHAMGEFARVWGKFTGGRVIGLATSTNAARVLQREGLAESYNIAQFLGKVEGSDELRRPVPVGGRDVLVVDEASQVSTADLALIQEAARAAGARTVLTGDTQQLGAVGAGGMFRLLVAELLRRGAAAELREVRRFDAQWEREASVRLRDGDFGAYAEYDRHGRFRAGDRETARDRAVTSWLADRLEGKRSLLMAGSNAEVADLSARAQAKLIGLGAVQRPRAKLSDGNSAGIGDLIRARLNTEIDAGGQKLTNRDTLKVTAWKGRHAEVRRQLADGTWSAAFIVPCWYLENSAELDYGANSHVAQGRTVQTGHPLISPTLTRQQFYVLMTRGTEANTAHVDIGPPGKTDQQVAAEAVIKAILQRDDADLSATEQIRASQEHVTSAGHLLTLYGAVTKAEAYPEIDQAITSRLEPGDAARYTREHARPVLQGLLRRAEIEGRDVRSIIENITADPMDGARSVAGVLHSRARAEVRTGPERTRTWAERTPEGAHPLAHELAAAIDARTAELGRRQAEEPEPWAVARLGELPENEAERDTWTRSAGVAALHREAHGVTDPEQDIATGRHPEPAFQVARADAVRELKVPDEHADLKAASRGELEARVLDGYRAIGIGPPDVSAALKLTSQAEADARADAAAAEVQHDEAQAQQQRALASQLARKAAELEQAQATRDAHDLATETVRARADLAREELKHRGYDPVLGWEPDTSDPEPDRAQDPDGYVEWALRQARIHDTELAAAAREKLAQREARADADAELAAEMDLLEAEEAEGVPAQADKYTLSIMGQHLQHGAAQRGGGGGEPPERSGGRRGPEPAADGSPFWHAGFRDGSETEARADSGGRNGGREASRDEPGPEAGAGRHAAVDDLLARMNAELAMTERKPQAQPRAEAEAGHQDVPDPGLPDAGQNRAAAAEEIRAEVAAMSAKVDLMAKQDAEREAERRAQMDEAGINEPVVHEPQAEPSLEPSWQPGSAQASYEPEPAAEIEPEMEIG
jgi:conjugative relaxase-like TrwC/TraI family protein